MNPFINVVSNHIYLTEVRAARTHDSREYLLSSPTLFSELGEIYRRLKMDWGSGGQMNVRIRLPYHARKELRDKWSVSLLRKAQYVPSLVGIDKLVGYVESEVVFATSEWMRRFESKPADKIILSPLLPDADDLARFGLNLP